MYLSNRQLHPIQGLITVVGASGQNVPFLGYVEMKVHFPPDQSGTVEQFETLALVVPDNEYNDRVPLLVGTNLAKQWKDALQSTGKKIPTDAELSPAWGRVYQALQSHERFESNCNNDVNTARSISRRPTTIKAHQTVILWAITQVNPETPTKVVVESCSSPTSSAVVVTPGLVNLPAGVNSVVFQWK